MKNIIPKLTLSLFIIITLSSCGTTEITYKDRNTSPENPKLTIERLTWGQHIKWRPKGITVTNKYISYGSGITHNNNKERSSSTFDRERVYFSSIKEIKLYKWRRWFRDWYLITVIMSNNEKVHLFRDKKIEQAQLYYDALFKLVYLK